MSNGIFANRPEAPYAGSRSIALAPLAVLLVGVVFLAIGLALNPRGISSPLVGKPVREFSLPPTKRPVAIDWEGYGVPETFVIDRQGLMAYRQIGPVNPEVFDRANLPLIGTLGKMSP